MADILAMDWFNLFHADCLVIDSDFTYKLYAATLAPIGLVVFLLMGQGMTRLFGLRGYVEAKYVLIFLYFVLPVTSTIILKSLPCNMFDLGNGDEEGFMVVDMTLECQGPKREWYMRERGQRATA